MDERAFERLYRRHVRDVYRFALALLRNPSDAEDVTQTTFLNAYRALQAGEAPRRPHSWLLTIAHNTARSRVRRAMRRPREVPLDDVVSQLAVPEHERTNVRELLRALGRLPFNQRAAITMRELEGRSYPEIAETLGVSVPAVEALLARARRGLRRHASAIRGLGVVGLPRSLRRLYENGEATAGGALGAGAAAKAVAVVVAAVAAGGVGLATSDAVAPAPPARTPVVVHAFAGAPASGSRGAVRTLVSADSRQATRAGTGSGRASVVRGSRPRPAKLAEEPAAAQGPGTPAGSSSSASGPAGGAAGAGSGAVGQAVASATAAAPVATGRQVQTPAVQVGPVQTAPVQTAPVQTAPVQAGPVQAGPVQAGPVQTPTVQAPPVQAPPVQAPTAQTPTVQTPPVRTPVAPVPAATVPAATVSTPSLPSPPPLPKTLP